MIQALNFNIITVKHRIKLIGSDSQETSKQTTTA